jgi:hypothetical protein
MAFTLSDVVPWGRSFEEYIEIFQLTRNDLDRRILGCGDGPAAFNAEATRRGHTVISCDPMYRFSGDQIRGRVEAVGPVMIDQLHRNREDYLWDRYPSPEALVAHRLEVLEGFLADYPSGLAQGRYVLAALPSLPFPDGEFGLAVCSHLLFTYAEQLPLEFHLQAIGELCRVAREVRIFPLIPLDPREPGHLEPVVALLQANGQDTEIRRVGYEFQKGANAFLRIRNHRGKNPPMIYQKKRQNLTPRFQKKFVG